MVKYRCEVMSEEKKRGGEMEARGVSLCVFGVYKVRWIRGGLGGCLWVEF